MASGFDRDFASIDELADVSDEAETRALEEQVELLRHQTSDLRSKLDSSTSLESKLEGRRKVLHENTLRLYSAAKSLVDERDAALRALRNRIDEQRAAPFALPRRPIPPPPPGNRPLQ